MWLPPEGADKEHYAAAVLLDDVDERTVAVEFFFYFLRYTRSAFICDFSFCQSSGIQLSCEPMVEF